MPLLFVASKISCAFFFSKLPGEIEQNNWKGRGGGCVSSNWELHIICAEKISPVLLTVITHSVCKYVSSFLLHSEVSGLLSLFLLLQSFSASATAQTCKLQNGGQIMWPWAAIFCMTAQSSLSQEKDVRLHCWTNVFWGKKRWIYCLILTF